MEYLFSKLKKMSVISVTDGRDMGRIYDVAAYYPDGRIKGFFVTGSKGFKLTRGEEFIRLDSIVKIGEDVVLVNSGGAESKPIADGANKEKGAVQTRRNFDEYE